MPFYTGGHYTVPKDTIYYYTSARLFSFYVGSVVVLVGLCVAGFVSLYNYHNLQKLEEVGITSQAEIVSHHISTGTKNTSYYITYSYGVSISNGLTQTYQTERQVNKETYDRLTLGEHLLVRYLPGQPDIARLPDVKEDNFGIEIGLWIIIALTVIEVYLIGQIIKGHRVRAKHRLEQSCR